MLEEAKAQCDYLLVGLHGDPTIDRPSKNRPVQSVEERHIQLSAVKFVDEVIHYDTEDDLLNILQTTDINVRIVGADYLGKDFTGKKYCEVSGIEVYYNDRSHSYSSTELRNRVKLAS